MIVLPVVVVFRAVTAFVFTAGLGLIMAAVVARPLATSKDFAFASSIPSFALTLGAVFLAGALGMFLLMPAGPALARDIRGEEDRPLPSAVTILLVVLCAGAAWQVLPLAAWWGEDRALLGQLVSGTRDPRGFHYIPGAILLSAPALSAAALAVFVLTSLLTIVAPARRAARILLACLLLQASLIAGAFLIAREMQTVAAAVLEAVSAEPGSAATIAGMQDWIARQGRAAAETNRPLAWMWAAYLVALFMVRRPTYGGASSAGISTASADAAPPLSAAPAVAPVASPALSDAFVDSSYSIHPRMTAIETFLTRRCSIYEIRTIPPSSRNRFSFSWTTGALRREPDGPDILRLMPAKPPGLFTAGRYDVADADGRVIASLEPKGADWEIVHPSGASIARVLRDTGFSSFIKYVAMVGEREVCRFKWAMTGLTVSSAQLEVDFGAAGMPFDRALAFAIAPLLEHQARLSSERSRST